MLFTTCPAELLLPDWPSSHRATKYILLKWGSFTLFHQKINLDLKASELSILPMLVYIHVLWGATGHQILPHRLFPLYNNVPCCLPWRLFLKLFSDVSKSSLPGSKDCIVRRACMGSGAFRFQFYLLLQHTSCENLSNLPGSVSVIANGNNKWQISHREVLRVTWDNTCESCFGLFGRVYYHYYFPVLFVF